MITSVADWPRLRGSLCVAMRCLLMAMVDKMRQAAITNFINIHRSFNLQSSGGKCVIKFCMCISSTWFQKKHKFHRKETLLET